MYITFTKTSEKELNTNVLSNLVFNLMCFRNLVTRNAFGMVFSSNLSLFHIYFDIEKHAV